MRYRPLRVPSNVSPAAATTAGLVMLGQRELSAAQIRTRLLRKGYPESSVAEALSRLEATGALDDARTAAARARHDLVINRHGRARVLRKVKSLGVSEETASRAVAAAFTDVNEDRMIADAVARRLRGAELPSDPRAVRRLFAWLLRQGFAPDRVQRLLRRRLQVDDE